MYMLPEYVIYTLNASGVFPVADVNTAIAKAGQVRALGFVVIIIAVLFMMFAIMGGKQG
jgi:hypothetical protein